jgi:hypothetical protein
MIEFVPVLIILLGGIGMMVLKSCHAAAEEMAMILRKKDEEHLRKEVDDCMKKLSELQKDFVASHLRSQVLTLTSLLESIENEGYREQGFALESLQRVETGLHRLRDYLSN